MKALLKTSKIDAHINFCTLVDRGMTLLADTAGPIPEHVGREFKQKYPEWIKDIGLNIEYHLVDRACVYAIKLPLAEAKAGERKGNRIDDVRPIVQSILTPMIDLLEIIENELDDSDFNPEELASEERVVIMKMVADLAQGATERDEVLKRIEGQVEPLFLDFARSELTPATKRLLEQHGPRIVVQLVLWAIGIGIK